MILATDITAIISAVFTGITGAAGIVISILLYRLNRHQQRESWMKVYKEIHEAFWSDPVMAKVRCWLNYDRAYLEIKPILQERRDILEGRTPSEQLTEAEYKCIDELDKFCNLALRVAAINSQMKLSYDQNLWKGLYIDYWITRCLKPGREELRWYVEEFYRELLQPELLKEKVDHLKKASVLLPPEEMSSNK